MFYAYLKRPNAGETLEATDIVRVGSGSEAHLEGKIEGYTEHGYTLSSKEEYIAAGNAEPDDTDESPNQGDAADVTNA